MFACPQSAGVIRRHCVSAKHFLANSIATGAAVYAILSAFPPVSALFNPAMTLVARLSGWISTSDAIAYMVAQVTGAIAGVALVHLMYAVPALQTSAAVQLIPNLWLAEGLATFTLVLTVLALMKSAPDRVAGAVSLYVLAAFWFNASLNPAVTIARSFTATSTASHGPTYRCLSLRRLPARCSRRVPCAGSSVDQKETPNPPGRQVSAALTRFF